MSWKDRPAKGSEYAGCLKPIRKVQEGIFLCSDLTVGDEILCHTDHDLKGAFTCYDIKVLHGAPAEVQVREGEIFYHQNAEAKPGKGIIELCAGAGAMGLAAQQLGCHVIASIEAGHIAHTHLARNSRNIHGRIGDNKKLRIGDSFTRMRPLRTTTDLARPF